MKKQRIKNKIRNFPYGNQTWWRFSWKSLELDFLAPQPIHAHHSKRPLQQMKQHNQLNLNFKIKFFFIIEIITCD